MSLKYTNIVFSKRDILLFYFSVFDQIWTMLTVILGCKLVSRVLEFTTHLLTVNTEDVLRGRN
jgi:hypothetical protein